MIGRAALLQTILAASVGAQSTLVGTVSRDSAGRQPVVGIEVSIPSQHAVSRTDSTGTYRLDGLKIGTYTVVVRSVGYQPIIAEVAIEVPDATLQNFMVEPLAQPLDTVHSKDRKVDYISPKLRAFEERRREGFGHFLSEAQLRQMDSRQMSEVISRFPGLTVGRNQMKSVAISTRKNCSVAVYLDGIETKDPPTRPNQKPQPPNLNQFSIDLLAGIEFYAGEAAAPMGFGQNGCGMLLLWTRER
ncbi:MAG TPA: carboxypeptidase regulatory-like domain-containing protein [Gemmatimonadaceae bacterium]